MKDRQALRQEKQQERDVRVAELHKRFPELAEMDRALQVIVLELVRSAMDPNADRQALNEKYRQAEHKRNVFLQQHHLTPEIYVPKWACPLCQDRGYITPGVSCQCRIAEEAKRRFTNSNLPPTSKEMTFESFSSDYYVDPDDMEKKVMRLKKMAAYIIEGRPIGNLILRGDVGRGKTHLAVAVANQVLDAKKSVFYGRSDLLMEAIRTYKYDPERENLSQNPEMAACNADLFILDDLGRESISEFVVTTLNHIIETRNLANKPWIMNTNLTPNELEGLYGARLMDRMLDKTTIFRLESNESIRLQKQENGVEMV